MAWTTGCARKSDDDNEPDPAWGVIGSGDVGGVELLEGEGQRQHHRPAPGKLEEGQGLLQKAYCFGRSIYRSL